MKYAVEGNWKPEEGKFEASPVLSEAPQREFTLSLGAFKHLKRGNPKMLWRSLPVLPGAEKFYNFTQLACELNEQEPRVAPTDSRNRPDQRMMENGDWEAANIEKVILSQ